MTHHMTLPDLGTPTHHTRVERWECDTNNHWNTRFYGRAFQMAAEAVAAEDPGRGAALPLTRHIRYFRELMVAAPVEVRSAILDGGAQDGALVHLLWSGDILSAAALDDPPGTGTDLPRVSQDLLPMILPRGISAGSPSDAGTDGPWSVTELGVVRPADVDHSGALLFETIIKLVSVGSHRKLVSLGFTPDYVRTTGISRMVAELRVTHEERCFPGDGLRVGTCLTRVSGKTFNIRHRLSARSGRRIATVEQCLIAVDLNARRAVEVPAFLRVAMAG